MYPIKERNAALKAFKEEKHKLQSLDLAEVVTESSLFGEYTVLKLTDKGRMLYFEEDAELFMEKPDKKELILFEGYQGKTAVFSGKEQEQLRLVGDTPAGAELSVTGSPAGGERAGQRHRGPALWCSWYRQDRVGAAMGAGERPGRGACRYQCSQKYVVRGE